MPLASAKSVRPTALLVLTSIAAVLSSAGCATCIKGTTQDIPVSSTPAGATVFVDGATYSLETPCTLKLARNTDHVIAFSRPGYAEEVRQISRKPTGTVRGNIWIGGLVGWGIDSATGADNDLVPDHIDAVLQPLSQPPPNAVAARAGRR